MNIKLKRKKILLIIQNDLLGGAEQLLKLLSEEYNNQGNEVKIIFVRKLNNNVNWKNISHNIEIQHLKAKSYLCGFIHLFFLLILTRERFDITISSNINLNSILGFLNKINLLKTKKLIIRETTSVFHREKGFKKFIQILKYKIGYSGADLIICQTDVMKKQFLENLPSSNKWKLEIIQNPINIEEVKENSIKSFESFQPFPSKKIIVSAGRFIHEKGFDLLIEAFSMIKDEFKDYYLLILGEGKLRISLEQQIKKLNLENRILLPGFVKNPYPYFRIAEVCVVSSRIEGFPNVLLQMSLLNDKVLTTNCAGNLDRIPSISICKSNDVEDLKIYLKKIIESEIDKTDLNNKLKYIYSINIKNYLSEINLALIDGKKENN